MNEIKTYQKKTQNRVRSSNIMRFHKGQERKFPFLVENYTQWFEVKESCLA